MRLLNESPRNLLEASTTASPSRREGREGSTATRGEACRALANGTRTSVRSPGTRKLVSKSARGKVAESRSGFTILEVLIALTASLLLLLGLARTYKYMGDRISERQSELELSSRLRDIATRLRSELQNATCDMTPPAKESASEGYLVYHEGPFTSATTLLGSSPNPAPYDIEFYRDSRFGDIDDYIAFTTRSEGGTPFVGYLPQGILTARRIAREINLNQIRHFEFQRGQATSTNFNNYNHADATRSVPFYSEVAEIAYWTAPRYLRNANDGTLVYDPNAASSGQPVFVDRNQDLLPDELDLHRRVLLVRPDLNMTPLEMAAANARFAAASFPFDNFAIGSLPATVQNTPTLPFLTRNNAGNLIIVPLSFAVPGQRNQAFFPSESVNAPADADERLNVPGLWWNTADTNNPTYSAPSWLTGVARMQQFMDLSISRVTDTWSTPAATRNELMTNANQYGMPTEVIKANSLAQLSRPENRFGFVRIPEPLVSGLPGSSMPVLALCPPHPYLMSRYTTPPTAPTGVTIPQHVQGPAWPSTFPNQADHTNTNPPPGSGPFLNVFGRFTMTTFLRPEFALADRVSDRGAGLEGTGELPATVNRGGSDIVATDVVGFDVRAFDPAAPQFIWEGADGAPGNVGDDDGNGSNPANPYDVGGLLELGLTGSDDEIARVSSLRADEALLDNGTRIFPSGGYGWVGGTPQTSFGRVNQGDFVDLNYARMAGGPMRGLIQFDLASGTRYGFSGAPGITTGRLTELESEFSGIQMPLATNSASQLFVPFPRTWEDSGRFILSRGGGLPTVSSFYQPTYDTWTDSYATDAFDQEGLTAPGVLSFTREPLNGGGTAVIGSYRERRVPQDNTIAAFPPPAPSVNNEVIVSNEGISYRRWTSVNSALGNNQGEFAASSAGVQQNAPTDTNPFHVTPPIDTPLRAIQITIRVNDFQAETIRQQTVVEHF